MMIVSFMECKCVSGMLEVGVTYDDLTFWILAATMNAFVLPGGKVFVYSGILPICRNDSGLAAVLG
jgi:predicted Zn-dependent protease